VTRLIDESTETIATRNSLTNLETLVKASDDGFMQPSDEYPQGNVLAEEEQALIKMNDSCQTPNKEDTKPAAQPKNEDSSPSPEPDRRRLN
jgi:hypothetical protein